ncbi:translation initiation factor eIF4e [Rhizophagus irregularis]|nr:translation initiation factor eIF4e [Rhizophagus irregularis]
MPMWEDEANQKGGRFTICPPRNQLNSLWDSIVLLLAGETIDDKDLICGAVCARRDRGDRVELWISGDAYSRDIDRIRDLLSMELGHEMKEMKNVKYKKHLGKP